MAMVLVVMLAYPYLADWLLVPSDVAFAARPAFWAVALAYGLLALTLGAWLRPHHLVPASLCLGSGMVAATFVLGAFDAPGFLKKEGLGSMTTEALVVHAVMFSALVLSHAAVLALGFALHRLRRIR